MNDSPLSEAIQAVLVPEKLTIPYFKLHAGTTDLAAHIQFYRRVMSLFQYDNALLCKVFPYTLDKGFTAWLQQFPRSNVTSFADLST